MSGTNLQSHRLPTGSTEPSQSITRNLSFLHEAEDGEHTKLSDTVSLRSSTGDLTNSPPPNRLSMTLPGWLGGSWASLDPNSVAENRKSVVSEPMLVSHFMGGGLTTMDTVDEDPEVDQAAFESMLVCSPHL